VFFFLGYPISSLILLLDNLYSLSLLSHCLWFAWYSPIHARLIQLCGLKKKETPRYFTTIEFRSKPNWELLFANFLWMWKKRNFFLLLLSITIQLKKGKRSYQFQLLWPVLEGGSVFRLSCLFHVAYNPVTADYLSTPFSVSSQQSHIERAAEKDFFFFQVEIRIRRILTIINRIVVRFNIL